MGTLNVVGVAGDNLGLPLWLRLIGATPLLMLAAAWFFMAATLVFRGDNVEKPNRMAQFYGYSVCLLAIIVGLVTISSLLGTTFDRAHPLESGSMFGESLSSFDAFKAERAQRNEMEMRAGMARPDTVPDAALHSEYDGLVKQRLASVRYESEKSLVTSGLMLIVSIVLFGVHWRWLRRFNGAAAA
ncbi:MAG TPA: hypothetical protein VJR24_18730 [Gemmatimonadaceae bacterium]|nr:hypothetical protein [Gemmatimonadaceae bacterium]